jgi:hypothetical protein
VRAVIFIPKFFQKEKEKIIMSKNRKYVEARVIEAEMQEARKVESRAVS